MADGTAPIGHNNPPEPSPFEAHATNISDLYDEAKNWMDGEPITTQEQADAVDRLLDMIREAHEAADKSRVEENEPFDTGKAAVQAKYAPLIADTKSVQGKTILAKKACLAALTPWKQEQERIRQEAADHARREAEEAARVAVEAARAAQASDLDAQERAEQLVRLAARADKLANKADKAATTGTGLRSYWEPRLVDGVAAARHYWVENREACEGFFLSLAQTDVRAGKRQIPGFEIIEDRRAI